MKNLVQFSGRLAPLGQEGYLSLSILLWRQFLLAFLALLQTQSLMALSLPQRLEPSCPRPKAKLIGPFFPQSSVAAYKGALYFQAWHYDLGGQVFLKFDGQKAEPVTGRNLEEMSYPDDFIVFHNLLFFSAKHERHGRDLWQFDGHEAKLIEDREPYTFAPAFPLIYKEELYFRGMGAEHLALFKYAHGTISQVAGIGYPSAMTVLNQELLVHGHRQPEGSGLYRFNGQSFTFLFPMRQMGRPSALPDGYLYFHGGDQLLPSTGPLRRWGPTGLSQVGENQASIYAQQILYKGSLYYRGDKGELLRFDGQKEKLVEGAGQGQDDPIVFNNLLFFMGSDRTYTHELFVFDGEQSRLFLAVYPGEANNSRPSDFIVFKGELYFSAWQKNSQMGFWKVICH